MFVMVTAVRLYLFFFFFLSRSDPILDDLYALELEFDKADKLMQEIVSIRDDLANMGFKIDLGKEL